MGRILKDFVQFISEARITQRPFDKNPSIGWWKDHDYLTMYHGTHESNLESIKKNGIKAGPNSWVSMTHDPNTAHGYASMSGGEANFRAAGSKARHVPHHERVVLIAKIPKKWAERHMDKNVRGNIDFAKNRLTDKTLYDTHVASGKPDHEYYATTELRFPSIPKHFIVGYSRKS